MKAILALVTLLSVVAAQESMAQFINDNNVLNYALTLENFEAALYASGSGFTDAQYSAAGFAPGTKAAIDYIGSIEAAHAALLTNVLQARGWPAVPACSGSNGYNFNYDATNVTQFVQTLATVESVGTSAYDGAATAITNKNLLTVAAGIATIEARHTSILNTILNNGAGGSFAPNLDANARTNAFNYTATLAAVTPFFLRNGVLITCPSNTTTTAYAGVQTVQSTNFTSYAWQTANSLRGFSNDIATFYTQVNSNISTSDLSVLQYALALENFEASFYANYSALYSVSSIQASFPSISAANASLISQAIGVIAQHEALHVAYLTTILNAFKVTPGTACNYTVPLTSSSTFVQFLNLSSQIENVGVAAYVGAIGFVSNSQVSTAAAAIATVEGEHAAYLTNLVVNGGFQFNPMPNTTGVAQGLYDLPRNPTDTYPVVGGFLAQCTAAQYGNPPPIGTKNSPFSGSAFPNFFGDQNLAFNAPFSSATPASTTAATTTTVAATTTAPAAATTTVAATTTAAGAPSTTAAGNSKPATTTAATGDASGLAACIFVVIAAILAAL